MVEPDDLRTCPPERSLDRNDLARIDRESILPPLFRLPIRAGDPAINMDILTLDDSDQESTYLFVRISSRLLQNLSGNFIREDQADQSQPSSPSPLPPAIEGTIDTSSPGLTAVASSCSNRISVPFTKILRNWRT